MKKVLGYLLIASPFLALILYGWYSNTLVSIIVALIVTAGIVGAISAGVYLTVDSKPKRR